jgi:mannose-6-phosphate isomerase
VLTGTEVGAYTTRYIPPFDEFEVDHIEIPVGASTDFENLGPSVFLCIAGIGVVAQSDTQTVTGIKKGDVFFVPSAQKIEIAATVEVDQDPASLNQAPLQLYRAGVNSCLHHIATVGGL